MSEEVKQEGDFKIKKKPGRPKKLNKKNETVKLDLTKKEEVKDAVQEPVTEKIVLQSNEEKKEQEVGLQEVGSTHEEKTPTEEVKEEVKTEETKSVLEEITTINETPTEPVVSAPEPTINLDLPENVEKLVEFMKDTGGTVEDYVRLNADYSNIPDEALLKEYYKKKKPYLTSEEIDLQLEDQFSFDVDYDDEKDIRRKNLAIKEEVAKAKDFLEETKKKYYDEIKLRPGVTQEQQKAMDFFNRYNKEQEIAKQQHEVFKSNTKQYFTNDFKGFDFNVGEKKFRYGVGNPDTVANDQSDISTWIKKFLNEDGSVKDHGGYHKAIYTARNADTIAKHFYDQGKADMIKEMNAKSKNISNETRSSAPSDVFINGLKVKAINGVDSSKLKIKKRKFNT